jgi:hypothetical protein
MVFRWCPKCGRKKAVFNPDVDKRHSSLDKKPFKCLECESKLSHKDINYRRPIHSNAVNLSNPERVRELSRLLREHCKAIADIKKFQKLGYVVKVYGTNISPEINVESGTKRFQKKGRYVPIEYIVQNTPKINKSVLEVSKYADESKIYDTTIKGRENAKVIYSKGS